MNHFVKRSGDMKRIIRPGIRLSTGKLLLVLLFAAAHPLSATTLYVGTCRSGPNVYSTVQAAINAAPAGAIVKVCPGRYTEQVKISQAVTLEGMTTNNDSGAQIAPLPAD
jgi:hypothetical protein